MQRYSFKPGITGLAQINDCRGETRHVDQMKRMNTIFQYINEWNIWFDIAAFKNNI